MTENTLGIGDILELIPHRHPFVMIDRVTQFMPHESIQAYKMVSSEAPWVTGHFPQKPIMPGVLTIEAMAQAAGVLALISLEAPVTPGNLFVLAGVNGVKFRRQVIPGDRLDMTITVMQARSKLWRVKGRATVDDQLACEAEITIAQGGNY